MKNDGDVCQKKTTIKNIILLTFYATLTAAYAQTINFEEIVEAGGVRCWSQGQDEKIYKSFYAGDGRYFVNTSLSTDVKEGVGNCNFLTDSPEPAVVTMKFQGIDHPVKYTVRAYADCGNFFFAASNMRQVCRFKASSIRGQ